MTFKMTTYRYRAWVCLVMSGAMPCAFAATATASFGHTVCVRCSGPEAVYSCDTGDDLRAPERSAGLFCASRIARDYGHESCATQRGSADCGGQRVRYDYPEHSDPAIKTNKESDSSESNSDIAFRKREPETLRELATDTIETSKNTIKKTGENIGEAGKATRDAIKDAGEAIGTATQKTLRCLGSALNDC